MRNKKLRGQISPCGWLWADRCSLKVRFWILNEFKSCVLYTKGNGHIFSRKNKIASLFFQDGQRLLKEYFLHRLNKNHFTSFCLWHWFKKVSSSSSSSNHSDRTDYLDTLLLSVYTGHFRGGVVRGEPRQLLLLTDNPSYLLIDNPS